MGSLAIVCLGICIFELLFGDFFGRFDFLGPAERAQSAANTIFVGARICGNNPVDESKTTPGKTTTSAIVMGIMSITASNAVASIPKHGAARGFFALFYDWSLVSSPGNAKFLLTSNYYQSH